MLIAAAAFFAQNGFQTAGVAAFSLLAAFPCYTLSLVGNTRLASDELHQQLRRHHGAEHTLFAYLRKNSKRAETELAAEDLQGYGYLDHECGTVWMATIIIWAAALGAAIALVPAWGAANSLKLVVAVTAMLPLNTHANPVNPLVNVQKPEVAPPMLEEIEVAVAAYNALYESLKDGALSEE